MLLFFTLVWRFCAVMASGCSSDRNPDHRPRVSCVDQGLSAVPDGIDSSTQVLVLSQNRFTTLSWSAYSSFPQLHELDLSQNHISVIEPSGAVLENLKVLRLSNNRLTGLGGRMFQPAPQLVEIYLDKNSIKVLHDTTFSDLQHLEIINLFQNQLPALPPRLLERVSSTSLKTFDLEGNRVQHLPDNFFSSKPELPYVYLSQNPWMCSCQVGYMQRYLEDQGHNVYKHTGPTSIENDAESVVCANPTELTGQAIINLQEDEYCSPDKPTGPSLFIPAGDALPHHTRPVIISTAPSSHHHATSHPAIFQPSRTGPAVITSVVTQTSSTVSAAVVPLTTSAPTSSQPTPTVKTNLQTAAPTTTPLSSTLPSNEPTTASSLITSPHPHILSHFWTTLQSWTHKHVWSEVWTEQDQESWTHSWVPSLGSRLSASSTTPTVVTSQIVSTLPVTSTPSSHLPARPASAKLGSAGWRSGRPVPWCWWLFAGVFPLCLLSGLCSCMLFLWLLRTYLTLYRPLWQRSRLTAQNGGVTLRAFRNMAGAEEGTGKGTREERVAFLPPEAIRGTQAVFRSVLFIEKGEEGEARSEGVSDSNGEDKIESSNGTKIDLVAAVEGSTEMTLQKGRREATDRKEVFRKTLYREISREDAIEGWREVEENQGLVERRVAERGGVERRKTRFSLILREENGHEMEDRKGGTEWLMGEWEMREGGMMEGSWESLIRKIGDGTSPAEVTQMDTPTAAGALPL